MISLNNGMNSKSNTTRNILTLILKDTESKSLLIISNMSKEEILWVSLNSWIWQMKNSELPISVWRSINKLLLTIIRNSLTNLVISIGLQRVQLQASRIKVNVVLAGHSLPPVLLKVLTSFKRKLFPLYQNNTWLIVHMMVTQVAMVVSWTLLSNSLNQMVFPLKINILTKPLMENAKWRLVHSKSLTLLMLNKVIAMIFLRNLTPLQLLLLLMQTTSNITLVVYSKTVALNLIMVSSLSDINLLTNLGLLKTLGALVGVKKVSSDLLLVTLVVFVIWLLNLRFDHQYDHLKITIK